MLTPRQQQAEAIARELGRLGVAVLNPLPLAAEDKLRFQVTDEQCQAILEKVSTWGWSVALCNTVPRFCLDGSVKSAAVYEINLGPDRQVIPTDDRHHGEIGREKPSAEVVAMLAAIGFGPK